jgi:hypothetical protein
MKKNLIDQVRPVVVLRTQVWDMLSSNVGNYRTVHTPKVAVIFTSHICLYSLMERI